MKEQTLVLLKPDAVQRAFVGEIISRFEKTGLKIIGLKLVKADKKLAEQHYTEELAQRRGQHIRDYNINFLLEGPVIAMILEGLHAIEIVRKIVGPTEPKTAPPGTIRGDYAHSSYAHSDINKTVIRNLIHASSDKKDAEREIPVWFKQNELFTYKTVHEIHTQ